MIVKRLEKSKCAFVLNTILCLIFSSAMFAGTIDMVKEFGNGAIIFIFLLFIVCAIVSKRGMKSLDKLNLALVPIMTVVLLIDLIYLLRSGGKIVTVNTSFGGISVIYSILYVVLNTSNSCVLVARLGKRLSDKQKTRVAFISALVLCLILSLINIVLLFNPSMLGEEMPLLGLFTGVGRQVLEVAIMIGCLTTLFSLIYNCSSSMRGLCSNEYLIFFISVIMPFILSLLGFGFIVSELYPLASIIGVFLLVNLTFIPFFKRANKKIHSTSKYTK